MRNLNANKRGKRNCFFEHHIVTRQPLLAAVQGAARILAPIGDGSMAASRGPESMNGIEIAFGIKRKIIIRFLAWQRLIHFTYLCPIYSHVTSYIILALWRTQIQISKVSVFEVRTAISKIEPCGRLIKGIILRTNYLRKLQNCCN